MQRIQNSSAPTALWLFLGLLIGVIGSVVTAAGNDRAADDTATPRPTPSLTPEQVVRTQIDALAGNSVDNAGIALTFNFASPANRAQTGPLPRFVAMVLAPPYDLLVNHVAVRYGAMQVEGDEAAQLVEVVDRFGQGASFLWTLSRQAGGRYDGCWMTDAVMPVDLPTVDRFSI